MASLTTEINVSPLSDSDFTSPSKRKSGKDQHFRSVSQRSLNLKSHNVPRHFSMQSISSVQEAEKTLTQLVFDFEDGKLHAFGDSNVLDRMQDVRTKQEALTQKHLAMDSDLLKKAARGDLKQDDSFQTGLTDLMSELKELTEAIQTLETPLNLSSGERKQVNASQVDGSGYVQTELEDARSISEEACVKKKSPLFQEVRIDVEGKDRLSLTSQDSLAPSQTQSRRTRRLSSSPQITEV